MKKSAQEKTKRRRTTFSCNAPEAKKVSLVGEFNNWNPVKHPMKIDHKGLWTKTIMLEPGVYEYKFLVDGTWLSDTENDQYRLNSFGTLNSLISISPQGK